MAEAIFEFRVRRWETFGGAPKIAKKNYFPKRGFALY
jgi:hypothetical protein